MTPEEKNFFRYILGKASNELVDYATKITGITEADAYRALDQCPVTKNWANLSKQSEDQK